MSDDIKSCIRTIPDFPIPGILFRDITGILQNPHAYHLAIDRLAEKAAGLSFDVMAGIESRGFLFSAPLALHFNTAFVPIPKKGKLPGKTISEARKLEYGSGVLEIHTDAIRPGQRVLLVDDLLATGGTALTGARLIEKLGGTVVGILFLIELPDLKGREKLAPYPVESIVTFEGE